MTAYRGTCDDNDFLYDPYINNFKMDEPIHPIWFSKSKKIAQDYVEESGHLYEALITAHKNYDIKLNNDDRIFISANRMSNNGKKIYNVSPNVSLAFKTIGFIDIYFWSKLRKHVGGDIDEISVFDLLMFPDFTMGMKNLGYDCITIAKQGQRTDHDFDIALGVLNPKIIHVLKIDEKPVNDESIK